VMVWDIGTYEIVDGNYWKGQLSIFLAGKKLKGEWTLSRTASDEGKPKWLLIKTTDNAKAISKTRESVSAKTGRTMEEVAADKSAVWNRNRDEEIAAPTEKGEKQRGKRLAPRFVKPMKATGVNQLPEGDEWMYEVKWDGYRVLALKNGNDVRLLSLKEKNLTSDFPGVARAVREIAVESAVIDGEVVAIDSKGCPSFQALQNRASSGREWQIVYYAFDLLHLEGNDWTKRPLHDRKTKLKEVLAGSDVRYNAELAGSTAAVVRTVEAAGLEGVVAKKRDSPYQAGSRVTSWLKLKIDKAQEFVIGGYKPDAGSFQSILCGYYDGKKLMFSGKVRQGFNPASRLRLLKEMRPLVTQRCPFANLPTSRKSHFGEGITSDEMTELCWLKPKLVAQVAFTEWTSYGLLRHATFQGLRDDKQAVEVVREF